MFDMKNYLPGYWVSETDEVVFAPALADLLGRTESGLFILEGPSGSGKTPLLHSLAGQNDIKVFSSREITDIVVESATRCILKKGVLEYELIGMLAAQQHSILGFEDLHSFREAERSLELLAAALSKIAESVTVVVTMNSSEELPHFLSGLGTMTRFRYAAL